MSKELFKNLLADFKKSNKERREKIAKKAGYNTIAEYELFLNRMILDDTISENITIEKPVIHVIDIIDCSGSMYGEKIKTAESGINKGILELKKDTNVIYKYSLCTFSYSSNIFMRYTRVDINDILEVSFKAQGYTALYDAIGRVFNEISFKSNNEKVLINIYTDGEENDSRVWNALSISRLIEESKDKGITVTFIGLKDDVNRVINKLKIEESNTLCYNGTAEDFNLSLIATFTARTNYATSVLAGEDVSRGFYKKDIEKTNKAYEAEKKAIIQKVVDAKVSDIPALLNELIENPLSKVVPGKLRIMKGRHYSNIDELGRI